MEITSKQLRQKWLNFYTGRGHVDIGAVSLIGDGTTGVMFNVAGMQPLMPYLLGQKHPKGKRLCNVQGCVRTIDIDEVGDESHCTFFEMMGNWSLGDYFKKEKTAWTFELLTKEFGLDKNKICATVFKGDKNVPRDDETANYLLQLGIKRQNIFFQGKDDNWWELEGTVNTPCGPDNEWFYPLVDEKCSENCDINCKCKRYVEIGNDVYMQYEKLEGENYRALTNKNVDTGFGFERMLMFLNGLTDVYKTDLFAEVISFIEKQIGQKYDDNEQITRSMRIIADHTRTSVMLIGDINGILPSNVGAGYILRRIMRRAIRHAKKIGLDSDKLINIASIFIDEVYAEAYPLMKEKKEFIVSSFKAEIEKFAKTIETGNKEFEKLANGIERKIEFMRSKDSNYDESVDRVISGKAAFRLYDTYGFPIEMTIEMAQEKGLKVDEEGFKIAFKQHQDLAKNASEKAKSGLASHGEIETKFHTATHLLNSALKKVVGASSHQMGSNINSERLRFDFACDHKLSKEEIAQVEKIVNGWIEQGIEVTKQEMKKEDAVKIGAEHQFIDRYPDIVFVYTIGDASKEICTGPHVQNTRELGHFKIIKEEASSSGVRRIKAILN